MPAENQVTDDLNTLLTILATANTVAERQGAAQEISKREDSTSIHQLGKILTSESEPAVRASIIDALLQLGGKQSCTYIEQAAKIEKDPAVRFRAINALGQLGLATSIGSLMDIATADSDPFVRRDAVRAVGLIADPKSIPELRNAYKSEKNSDVRSAITQAFGRIHEASVVTILGEIIRQEDDVNVRIDAIGALGKTRHKDAAVQLIRSYEPNTPPNIRKSIEEALLDLPHEGSIPPLVKALLQQEDSEVKIGLASILASQPEWETKLLALAESLRVTTHLQRRDIDSISILRAIKPPDAQDNPYVLTDRLIELSLGQDHRVTAILARLIIENSGGDVSLAGERTNSIQAERRASDEELRTLRIEIGGETALDPIIKVLQDNLEQYFRQPISELNKLTQGNWQKTIQYAQWGFLARMIMSVVVFIIGMLLLVASSFRIMYGQLDPMQVWGAGVSFVSGLGAMLLVIYRGPLREIRNSVNELGIASASFIAYVHRILQVSHTFSFYYLKQNVSYEQMKQSSDLIGIALSETVNILIVRDPDDMDKISKDVVDRISSTHSST